MSKLNFGIGFNFRNEIGYVHNIKSSHYSKNYYIKFIYNGSNKKMNNAQFRDIFECSVKTQNRCISMTIFHKTIKKNKLI